MSLLFPQTSLFGGILAVAKKNKETSIADETINYNVNVEDQEDIEKLMNSGFMESLRKVKNSEVNFSFNLPKSNDSYNINDEGSLRLDKSSSIDATASNNEEKPISASLLGGTTTGTGNSATKGGLDTTTLIIGGVVVVAIIFLVPMFIGGAK